MAKDTSQKKVRKDIRHAFNRKPTLSMKAITDLPTPPDFARWLVELAGRAARARCRAAVRTALPE